MCVFLLVEKGCVHEQCQPNLCQSSSGLWVARLRVNTVRLKFFILPSPAFKTTSARPRPSLYLPGCEPERGRPCKHKVEIESSSLRNTGATQKIMTKLLVPTSVLQHGGARRAGRDWFEIPQRRYNSFRENF